MTPQELFDDTMTHLIHQGRPSARGGRCALRGSRGRKCAIGRHIPDEEYRPALEWRLHEAVSVALRHRNARPSRMLMNDLQDVHDNAVRGLGSCWIDRVREYGAKVALKHGLDDSVCWFEVVQ